MSVGENAADRMKVIIKTSIIGIVANCFLAAFKAAVGMITGSIAIIMDAVNNLSDAASSVITIAGTHLAAKKPDRKHPFGHGRVEYLTAMLIAIIVMYAGVTSMIESVKKIIRPEPAEYDIVSLIIIIVAIVVKIVLGHYVKKTGKRVRSDSLIASGQDALLDSVISASTLLAALIFIFFGLSLEAYLAAVISVIIIKSGIDMLRVGISQILGERADADLTASIKKAVAEFPEVHGVYDLILNNYGPDIHMASFHVEVDGNMTAPELDSLSRKISDMVFHRFDIIVVAVGVYAVNKEDEEAAEILKDVRDRLEKYPDVLQMHGFYLNKEEKSISFDVIVDFSADDRAEVHRRIKQEIRDAYPDYRVSVTLDQDFSD